VIDLTNVDIGYLNIGCLKIELFFQARLEACTKPIDAKTQAHGTGHLNHSMGRIKISLTRKTFPRVKSCLPAGKKMLTRGGIKIEQRLLIFCIIG